ncbi:MAG: capsule biosynthesis protein CapK, partial [Verrucomicrobiaceae bacterium]
YVSVTPSMEESGLAKINLHPDDWRDPADRVPYLEALAPEVLAGDPLSFSALLELPLRLRPRALLCTSMALFPGLRSELENWFGCPVLDLYSMSEAGPIAVADESASGHVLLQHCLYVEILDAEGTALPPGQRGEITLTGGFNDCLPLLRYRTGDYAALHFDGPEPVLVGLSGRPPVRFRTHAGEWLNNLEVTHTLGRFALAQFALHQDAAGGLHLRLCRGHHDQNAIAQALRKLFGSEVTLEIQDLPELTDKLVQYTSDLAGAQP